MSSLTHNFHDISTIPVFILTFKRWCS